jgi:hypothetical protein
MQGKLNYYIMVNTSAEALSESPELKKSKPVDAFGLLKKSIQVSFGLSSSTKIIDPKKFNDLDESSAIVSIREQMNEIRNDSDSEYASISE